MYRHKQELALPNLRRQLEELLAMLATNRKIECRRENAPAYLSGTEAASNDSYPDPSIGTQPEEETRNEKENDRDVLSDDALVVITEFGHASAAILQMWLSIDYGRAIKIINQFQSEGLISTRGRVRHKAFVLRHKLS